MPTPETSSTGYSRGKRHSPMPDPQHTPAERELVLAIERAVDAEAECKALSRQVNTLTEAWN